jgi:hypothetical protein
MQFNYKWSKFAFVFQIIVYNQMRSFSISCCKDWICGFSCDPSWTVTEQAITERETPQARPRAIWQIVLNIACYIFIESSKTYLA